MQLWDKVRFYNINGHLWDIKSQLQKNTVVILFIFTPRQKKGLHTSILSPSNLPSRPPFPLHSLLAIYSIFYTSTAILLLQVTFRYLSISFTTFQIVAISTIYPIIGLLAYTHKAHSQQETTLCQISPLPVAGEVAICCRVQLLIVLLRDYSSLKPHVDWHFHSLVVDILSTSPLSLCLVTEFSCK